MIRTAILNDIPEILELTRACAAELCSRGIFQWNENYPNSRVFTNDVARKELYVFHNPGKILGCITLTELEDAEYAEVSWPVAEGRHLYVHRLAVHPLYQGKGIASQLMRFGETLAREQGYDSVRLDTFSKNTRSNALYQGRGYQACGTIQLPEQSAYPFNCYELPL